MNANFAARLEALANTPRATGYLGDCRRDDVQCGLEQLVQDINEARLTRDDLDDIEMQARLELANARRFA